MRKILGLILLSICVPFSLFTEITIGIVGDSNSSIDSIVANEKIWPRLLEQSLKEKNIHCKIANFSVGALSLFHSYWVAHNLFEFVGADIVILTAGLNDGLAKLPIHLCRRSMDKLLNLCFQNKAKIILGKTQMDFYMGVIGLDYTESFNQMYEYFEKQDGITVFEFITLEDLHDAEDHLHPDVEWHKRIAETVEKIILLNHSVLKVTSSTHN